MGTPVNDATPRLKTAYLTDAPASLAGGDDGFAHGDYATAVIHAIRHSEPPFTVGLFGPWGVGKSTVLQEVQRQLNDKTHVVVVVDAWRYEDEAFRRHFIKDVGQQLEGAGALKKGFDVRKALSDLYESTARPVEFVTLSVGYGIRATFVLFVLAAVLYLAGVLTTGELLAEREKSDPAVVAVLALMPLIFYALNRATDVIQVKNETVTTQRLEEPELFTKRFGQLLDAVDGRSVLIAVDNLDRLPADDAVKVLGTIKAYLEPVINEKGRAGATPSVRFLITADDAALRQHLAHRAATETGASETSAAAQLYADDYLRKFFNAFISFRPALREDVREYTAAYLQTLWGRWALPSQQPGDDQSDFADLIRVTSAGLRSNPRRIKQFVNNLELRLQFAKSREPELATAEDGTALRRRDAIVHIAKLAVLEEEFPVHYALIASEPGLLASWTEKALAGTPLAAALPGPDARTDDDAALAAFLRATSHIETSTLRPFLRLKQTTAETAVHAFDEFHAIVTKASSIESLGSFTSSIGHDSDEVARYQSMLPDVVDERLRAGDFDGALAVVGATVSDPVLSQPSEGSAQVLMTLAREPDLRAAISSLSLRELAAAAVMEQVPTWAFNRIVLSLAQTFAEAMNRPESGELRTHAGEALASVADRLDSDAIQVAKSAVNSPESDPRAYAPLVAARPDLMDADEARWVVRLLDTETLETEGGLPFSGGGALWKAALTAASRDSEASARLLDYAAKALLESSRANIEQYLTDVDDVLRSLTTWPAHDFDKFASVVTQVAIAHGAGRQAMPILDGLFGRLSPPGQESVCQALTLGGADDFATLEGFIAGSGGPLYDELRRALAGPALMHLLTGPKDVSGRARGAINALLGTNARAFIAEQAEAAAAAERFQNLARFLERAPDALEGQAEGFVSRSIERIRGGIVSIGPDLQVLEAAAPLLDEAHRKLAVDAVAGAIGDRPGHSEADADALRSTLKALGRSRAH